MRKATGDEVAFAVVIAMIVFASVAVVGSGIAMSQFMVDDMPSYAPLPRAGQNN